MRKVTSYKCPECEMKFKSLAGWGNHMHRVHSDTIPKGYSDARYFYYCQTGKSSGKCVQCKKPTSWNEETGKYNRYCDNPKCKQDYCKMAKKRMIDKYGKVHLLNDPEKQREMLANRKISGKYTFQDGGSLGYVGSYEKDFLMMCDHTLGLKSSDIMSPSPHNYIYIYEGKEHFYIPDFYIPNLNLELEIKDGSTNPNMMPKIQQIDKVKEKIKDEIMIANPSVNYFKVVNKEYDHFFEFLNNCKNAIDDDFLTQIQSRIATEGAMDDDIEGYEVANEGAIINQPDQYFNIDNWHKGKNTNILYITGLSGSGKSTTGKSIANTHSAVYIELDRALWGKYVEVDWTPEMPKNRDIANSFFREIYSDPELNFDPKMKDNRTRQEIIRKINYRLWDLCKSMPEVLFVWEGVTICTSFDYNFLQNKPVIIKGTSITTSMTRMNKRAANYHLSMKNRMEQIDWYREDENNLNALRNKMSKNAISSPSLESAQSHEAPLSSFKFRETDVKIGKTPAKLYEWYDGDNLVGSFRMFNWWDGKNIEDLKVSDAYKGKGYSYQLLDYATKKAGCKNLAVKKSNNIAKHVYDRYGFKVTQEDNDMYYMSLDSVMTQWSPVVPYNGEFDANAIDPTFTDEVAKMFAKCFAVENTAAAEIVQKRFGMVIYRPVDTKTSLPPMTQSIMKLTVPNETQYYLSTVHDDIITEFNQIHSKWMSENINNINAFANSIRELSTADTNTTRGYIKWVTESTNSIHTSGGVHELTLTEYQNFIDAHVTASASTIQSLKDTQNEFITAAKSHMGTAIGNILPKRRAELFKNLYLSNTDVIHELITNSTKKTVIFSPMVDVVDTIYNELQSSGIGTVKITGKTNNRMGSLVEFRNNPSVLVMVATTGTLGEGFTLNEANQLFFFGTPWRSADYDQASKRIHRIGQDSPVTVTNVLLKSDRPNLSDRMQSILVWSRNMFDTSISSIEFTEAFESGIGTDPNIVQVLDNKKYYPLFIILLCNKSLLGDTIRTVTKEPYSHSSISFDASMNDIYTFGNKIIKKGEYTKRSFGSARESFKHDSFKFSYPSEAKYGIYCIFFNEKQIKAMKAKVENIFENHEQYHYNIEGLIKYVFGKASTDPYKLFCSQFVSTIISTGKKDILDRDPSLYSPWGLTSLEGIQHIEDGNIATYDQKRVEKKTKEIFKMIVRSGDTAILESAFNFNEILSYGNDIALPDASLEMSLEAAIASDDSKLKFETPQELIKWMKSNIAYKEFDHLMTAEEVFVERRGSCHDQANFIVRQLNRMGIRASKLFFIAYNDHSTVGGMTHTLVYYTEGKNVIWVENSWVGNQGVRSYRNESDMRMDVFRRYQRTSDFSMYPELEFKAIKGIKPGMTLPQYVDAIMK